MDAWGPDFLGPGFDARTLELLPDDEDDGAVATLVRHVPAENRLHNRLSTSSVQALGT